MTGKEDDDSIIINVKNPIASEEEYKEMWEKDPIVANILLVFTENMDKNGDAYFNSYDELTERINMRFAYRGEYKWKITIN